jgi:transcriptional regulator GlxA family with amidase domain
LNVVTTHRTFQAAVEVRQDQHVGTSSFAPPVEFLVLLVPGFSQLCLSSLIDPLRIANTVAGREVFRWRLVSEDGGPVESASGIGVCASGSIREAARQMKLGHLPGAVVACADGDVERRSSPDIRQVMRLCARRAVPLYGLGTGAWLLAEAGLLDNASCTIHWAMMAALSETFASLDVCDVLFVRHQNTITCAGELAALDLALELIEQRGGAELARSVSRVVMADNRREGESRQTAPAGLRYSGTSDKLIKAIRIMERAIEDPIPLAQIARQAGLSRRQIERLFHQHLMTTPLRYYLQLRLARARQLFDSTNMPVLDVAIACGFVSASHFTACFKKHYGVSPSRMRRAAASPPMPARIRVENNRAAC